MTSATLLAAVAAALLPRVSADGGVQEVAASLEEAREYLLTAPARWRLILLWDGYGSHPAAREGMTSHQVTAVLQQARGLPAASAPKLLSFADRIEQVSCWIRAMRFPDGTGADAAGFALADSRWLETHPSARAHALSFTLTAALPSFGETIPLTF